MRNTIIESLKEMGRVCLLAVIPVVVDMLSNGKIDFKAIAIIGANAALRFIDKALYLEGKAQGNETLQGGLTRF